LKTTILFYQIFLCAFLEYFIVSS